MYQTLDDFDTNSPPICSFSEQFCSQRKSWKIYCSYFIESYLPSARLQKKCCTPTRNIIKTILQKESYELMISIKNMYPIHGEKLQYFQISNHGLQSVYFTSLGSLVLDHRTAQQIRTMVYQEQLQIRHFYSTLQTSLQGVSLLEDVQENTDWLHTSSYTAVPSHTMQFCEQNLWLIPKSHYVSNYLQMYHQYHTLNMQQQKTRPISLSRINSVHSVTRSSYQLSTEAKSVKKHTQQHSFGALDPFYSSGVNSDVLWHPSPGMGSLRLTKLQPLSRHISSSSSPQ